MFPLNTDIYLHQVFRVEIQCIQIVKMYENKALPFLQVKYRNLIRLDLVDRTREQANTKVHTHRTV